MKGKEAIAASLAICLAIGGCASSPQNQEQKEAKEIVYDKPADNETRYYDNETEYYDALKRLAQEAEAVEQTPQNTTLGTVDETNSSRQNASWVHDKRYTEMCAEKAQEYGSDTDFFAYVDLALYRATFLRKSDSGSWMVVSGFDCGIGASEKELGFSDSNETHTRTGVFKVDHKNEQLGGLKWWVCYIPYWTEDGLDDGQGFHNLYLGYGGMYSNGCVRLSDVNSKWVFDNLPIGSTVVVEGDSQ